VSAIARLVLKSFFSTLLLLACAFPPTPKRRVAAVSNGTLLFLGNGPSLTIDLQNVEPHEYDSIAVVNHFAATSLFVELKPSLYFLQDTYWFLGGRLGDRESKVIESLANDVDWPLTLFVPSKNIQSDSIRRVQQNLNIRVRSMRTSLFSYVTHASFLGILDEMWLFRLWRAGFLSPPMENIVATGIFNAHRLGFGKLLVCGLDMSMMAGLGLDSNRKVTFTNDHFYGEEKLQGLGPQGSDRVMSDNIFSIARKFRLFDLLGRYFRWDSFKVVNLTAASHLDSFRFRD